MNYILIYKLYFYELILGTNYIASGQGTWRKK